MVRHCHDLIANETDVAFLLCGWGEGNESFYLDAKEEREQLLLLLLLFLLLLLLLLRFSCHFRNCACRRHGVVAVTASMAGQAPRRLCSYICV